MKLTGKQEKYIRKNYHSLSAEKMAERLQVDLSDVHAYIKERWGEHRVQSKPVHHQEPEIEDVPLTGKSALYNIYGSIFLLFILVFLTYANTLGNSFVSDDIATIVQDPNIAKASSFLSKPFVFVQPFLFYILVNITGVTAVGFHVLNILLHFGVVALIYAIFLLLQGPLFALIGASLFAVHPLLSEAVTWISGNSYLLYSFFFLGSFYSYLRAKENYKWYFLSVALFILSLFSASKAAVLCMVFVAYEMSQSNLKASWKRLIPFFIFGGAFVAFYVADIGNRVTSLATDYYQPNKLYNPLLQVPIAITEYFRLFLWPSELSFYHSELAFTPFQYALRLIIFLSFLGFILYSYLKKRVFFFWLSFFVIALSPTLTPFSIAWVVAERYVYLGAVGLVFIATYYLHYFLKNRKWETLTGIVFVCIIISLTIRTFIRNFDWQNEDTLWLATGKTAPSDPKTHNNLGDYYGRQGDLDRAIYEFELATKLNPRYADAYHNLGNIYKMKGNNQKAVESYDKALSINPRVWQSYQNKAALHFENKKYDEAVAEVKKGLQVSPNNPSLNFSLGIIYLNSGRKEEAKAAFMEVLKVDPNHEEAKAGLQRANE